MIEGRRFSSRWSDLMKECLSYIEFLITERGFGPKLEEVRKFMLKEHGLRCETTSSILRDLDRTGAIKALGNRITLRENQ